MQGKWRGNERQTKHKQIRERKARHTLAGCVDKDSFTPLSRWGPLRGHSEGPAQEVSLLIPRLLDRHSGKASIKGDNWGVLLSDGV